MSIKPTIHMTQRTVDQFVGLTRTSARRFARAELETMGRDWEGEVQRIAQEELPRRDGVRHKENTTHLENSFTHRIDEGGDGGFPMALDLTTKPGVNAKKVAALNFGNPDHEITAVNTTYLRWGDAPPDITAPFQKSVMWTASGPNGKGKAGVGYHFMERARDIVLARHRRRV